ncbi:MAG: DedA family protein [Alphaproteobacteria bacterium]|nr:DedA family protein [Alphaproteobacteria bacterium]
MDGILPLTSLFFSALLAATIIPAQSEAVLVGLHLTGDYDEVLLVVVATLGNVLGACINWVLGRYLAHFKHRRWFPVKEAALDKAARTYQRFGVWTLLLSWVPIIGDPLTLIAGVLRTNFFLFVILVTIGKLARYVTIVVML